MIKLKNIIKEAYPNRIEFYKIPVYNYVRNIFEKEYDDRQLLTLGIAMDSLIYAFASKMIRSHINI
jgi:hypothetical protein